MPITIDKILGGPLLHSHKAADIGGLTPGSIPFADSAGNLTQNNTQLFWDSANNRLGIATNTPSAKNHIVMNGVAGEGAILVTGKSLDGTTDTNGVGFYLSHNAAGNRQWAICDSLSGLGIRFLGPNIDGFKYTDNSRQNMIMGTTTTGVGFGGVYREGSVSIDATAAVKNLVLRLSASSSVNCFEVQNSAGTPKLAFGTQATTDCLIKWPAVSLGAERLGLDFFSPGNFGSRIGIDSNNGDFLYQDTSAGPAGVTRFSIARATGALGISGTSILFGALVATTFTIKSNTYNGSTYIDALAFQTFDNGAGQRTRLTITAGGTIANAVATVRVDKAQFLISNDRAQDVIAAIIQAASTQTQDLTQWQSNTGTVFTSINASGQFGAFAGFADGINIAVGTTTGTKIGTATTQKLGFWNTAPIVQPTTAGAAATFVANTSAIVNDTATFDGYTIGQVVKALRNTGILA